MPATPVRVALAAPLLVFVLFVTPFGPEESYIKGPCDPLQWVCDHLQGGIDEFCRETKEFELPSHHHYCGSAYGGSAA